VFALLGTLLLWNIPYGWVLLYPFKIFGTWLHESSHGLVMLVTGAGLQKLEIFRDTSGLAHPTYSVITAGQVAISSAGYLGTSAFGALFLVAGRTPRGARLSLVVLGAVMILSVAFFVRNLFGVGAILIGALAILFIALEASDRAALFLLSFLAAQSCINAVLDIRVLFASTLYVNGKPAAVSDADAVARLTGGPSWLWASLWLAVSFGLFYLALRVVGRSATATDDDRAEGRGHGPHLVEAAVAEGGLDSGGVDDGAAPQRRAKTGEGSA
jgi:hypothetical protein